MRQYANGNPTNYTDPSGDAPCNGPTIGEQCGTGSGGRQAGYIYYDYKADPVLGPYTKYGHSGLVAIQFQPFMVPIVSDGTWIDENNVSHPRFNAQATWQSVDDTYLLAAAIMAEQGQYLLTDGGRLDGLGIGWTAWNRRKKGDVLRNTLLSCNQYALGGTPHPVLNAPKEILCSPGNSGEVAQLSGGFGGVQSMEIAYALSYGIREDILADPTGGRTFFASEPSGQARFGHYVGCDQTDANGNCTAPYQSINEITRLFKQYYGIPC